MNDKKDTDEEQALTEQNKNAVTLNGKAQKVKPQEKPKSKAKYPAEDAEKDPFILLGTGMVAYRDLLYTFIWAFFVFSLLSLPVMFGFNQYTAYDNIPKSLAGYEKFSLGNMGYSSTQCGVVELQVGQLAMTCPYGYVGQLLSLGVNPVDTKQTACVASSDNQQCTVTNNSTSPIAQNVTQAAQAGDATFVSLEVSPATIYGPDVATVSPDCTNPDAFVYVQFECIQNQETMIKKYHVLCGVATIGVFIALLFLLVLRNLRKATKIKRLEWDLSTVTAADYTVSMPINKPAYLKWREEVYNAPDGPFAKGVAPMTAYKN